MQQGTVAPPPSAVLSVHLCRTSFTKLSEANSRTFTLKLSLCLIHHPDFLIKSANMYAHVLFWPRRILSYQSFNNIISQPILLPMGTLCVGVLDHLVWSMHKRTAPSRDASSLQTDTSSKGRESASRVQVSSFWVSWVQKTRLALTLKTNWMFNFTRL